MLTQDTRALILTQDTRALTLMLRLLVPLLTHQIMRDQHWHRTWTLRLLAPAGDKTASPRQDVPSSARLRYALLLGFRRAFRYASMRVS